MERSRNQFVSNIMLSCRSCESLGLVLWTRRIPGFPTMSGREPLMIIRALLCDMTCSGLLWCITCRVASTRLHETQQQLQGVAVLIWRRLCLVHLGWRQRGHLSYAAAARRLGNSHTPLSAACSAFRTSIARRSQSPVILRALSPCSRMRSCEM